MSFLTLFLYVTVAITTVITIARLIMAFLLMLQPTVKGRLADYKITVEQTGWTYCKLRFNKKEKLFWLFPIWSFGDKYGCVKSMIFVEEKMTPDELEQWKRESLIQYEDHCRLWEK